MHGKNNLRYLSLVVLFVFISLVWILHLYLVTNTDPFNLAFLVRTRYKPRKIIEIPKRGSFYDRNNNLLASSLNYYQLDIDLGWLKVVAEKRKWDLDSLRINIANILAPYSKKSPHELYQRFKKNENNSIMIIPKILEVDLRLVNKQIAEKKYPKLISSFIETKRVYSQGILAGRLLGLVQKKDESSNSIYPVCGFNGLEASFEDDLKGKFGWKQTYVNAHAAEVTYMREKEKKAVAGYSYELTIDMNLQEILERYLRKGITDFESKNAIGVFVDVETGEILAMASTSRYEVENKLYNDDTKSAIIRSYNNNGVAFSYEPGSTFKPFIALLALQKQLLTPESIINCKPYRPKGRRKPITDSHPLKKVPLTTVITESSNVGIAKVAELIGEKDIYDFLIELGFGRRTASGIQGEAPGFLANVNNWGKSSIHSISFGQEVTVNPLHMAISYAALANGGKMLKPLIWRKKFNPETKETIENKPFIERTISSQKYINQVNKMLELTVEEGTGDTAKLGYIKISGKTGTAEKVIDGEYSKDFYIASFAGFFPSENPKIAGIIIFDETSKKYHFGSMSAAPTFKKVVDEYLNLYKSDLILEQKEKNTTFAVMPKVTGLDVKTAKSVLNKLEIPFKIIGSGKEILNQFPKANVKFALAKNTKVTLVAEDENQNTNKAVYTMPDLKGKSIREALKLCKMQKVILKVKGRGIIYEQSIEPGSKTQYKQICVVKAK